jgi:hypothetical protein
VQDTAAGRNEHKHEGAKKLGKQPAVFEARIIELGA